MENAKILRKTAEICKTFIGYFVNIIDKFHIYNWRDDASNYSKLTSQMSVFNNNFCIQLIKVKC